MNDIQAVKGLLLAELARAEFVIEHAENSKKKAHQPTVEYFRGQRDLIAKVLHYARQAVQKQNRDDVLAWYVAARSDGWECESFFPSDDHWEHAILTREKYVADVDIVLGYLVLWLDHKELKPKFPYKWPLF